MRRLTEIIRLPVMPRVAFEDNVRLLSEDMFDVALDHERLKILKIITFGVTRPCIMMKKLRIPKSTLYRHLNLLLRSGWLEKKNGEYILSSSIYLVYRVVNDNYKIEIEILSNKGAFIDEKTGFIIITGKEPTINCTRCPLLTQCTSIVKDLASRLEIKIRSSTPAEAFVEIMSKIATRIFSKQVSNSYLDVKLRT